ncbi:MAG: VWA domain-containing protein, partial [Planctomycetales bacterium]|nr:VWA domain-containing protein [Planctomycetales bacterium]
MSRIVRAVLAATVAVGASATTAVGDPASAALPTLDAATGSTESGGIAKFGACLSGRRTADVVLLIDESGSLKESDPKGARVDAAQYLLKQWSRLSVESGVKIAIQTMGFAGSVVHNSGRWLDAGDAYPTLKEDLEAFRARNEGQQTDYWMALDGARKALNERAGGGGSSCQAILWFSDGKLDAFATYPGPDGKELVKPYLEGKADNAAATAAAANDLCRTGGVADQVRSSGVATFAIGLQAGTAVAGDFDLMKSIALDRDCGAVSAVGTGDFRLATDIDGLIMAFDALRTPGQLPLIQRLKVCQGEICTEDTHQFVLDDSINRVHVAASAKADNLKLFIVPPKGGPVEVPMSGERTVKVRAAEVSIEGLSKRTVSLDFRNTGRWTGQWGIVFVDPKRASKGAESMTSLELSADIEPSLELPADKIYAGEKSAPVTLGLRHHDGRVIDPTSLLGTVKMDATFTDVTGKEIPVASGLDANTLGKPIALDLTSAAEGMGVLTATVTLTTAGIKSAKDKTVPGTTLVPSGAALDVPVLPPVGFPIVDDAISFGTATGAAKTVTSVHATGPGCVWFDGSQIIAAPDKAGAVTVTSSANSAATCIMLAEGESKDIPVEFTTAKAANGSVNGTLSAHLAPIDEPDRAR